LFSLYIKSRPVCRLDKIYDTEVQITATFGGITAMKGIAQKGPGQPGPFKLWGWMSKIYLTIILLVICWVPACTITMYIPLGKLLRSILVVCPSTSLGCSTTWPITLDTL